MAAFDSQTEKYHVTARLFKLISDLSQDKQFILYKQLIKNDVSTRLFKLIIEMSEEEKIQLLEKLGGTPYEEEPIRTINLDENDSFMRENPRKICSVAVNCRIENRSFKSYIIDISAVGAFIEISERFPIDQDILLAFKLPNYPKAFKLRGRIARSGSKGIGVKFLAITHTQQEIIRRFIESKQ